MKLQSYTDVYVAQDELLLANEPFFTEVAYMLSQGRCVTIRAKGDSMFPFIVGGRDRVVLAKSNDIGVGDIVLARLPGGRYVLHRVYRVEGDGFVLMGDGNLQATERCRKEHVQGKAVRIIRDDRFVDCVSPGEHRKAAVWRWLLPLRRYLLRALRLCPKLNRHSL